MASWWSTIDSRTSADSGCILDSEDSVQFEDTDELPYVNAKDVGCSRDISENVEIRPHDDKTVSDHLHRDSGITLPDVGRETKQHAQVPSPNADADQNGCETADYDDHLYYENAETRPQKEKPSRKVNQFHADSAVSPPERIDSKNAVERPLQNTKHSQNDSKTARSMPKNHLYEYVEKQPHADKPARHDSGFSSFSHESRPSRFRLGETFEDGDDATPYSSNKETQASLFHALEDQSDDNHLNRENLGVRFTSRSRSKSRSKSQSRSRSKSRSESKSTSRTSSRSRRRSRSRTRSKSRSSGRPQQALLFSGLTQTRNDADSASRAIAEEQVESETSPKVKDEAETSTTVSQQADNTSVTGGNKLGYLQSPWYYEECSRELSEQILAGADQDGGILLRSNKGKDQKQIFIISTRLPTDGGAKFRHFKITEVMGGYKIMNDSSCPTLPSLAELVEWFIQQSDNCSLITNARPRPTNADAENEGRTLPSEAITISRSSAADSETGTSSTGSREYRCSFCSSTSSFSSSYSSGSETYFKARILNVSVKDNVRIQEEDENVYETIGDRPRPLVCSDWQSTFTVSSNGGSFEKAGSDVTLTVPRGAVEEDKWVFIHTAVSSDFQQIHEKLAPHLSSGEVEIASPLVEYFVTEDFKFPEAVVISLPHIVPEDVEPDWVQVYCLKRSADGSEQAVPLPRVGRDAKDVKLAAAQLAAAQQTCGESGRSGFKTNQKPETDNDSGVCSRSSSTKSTMSKGDEAEYINPCTAAEKEPALVANGQILPSFTIPSFRIEGDRIVVTTDHFSAYVCTFCYKMKRPLRGRKLTLYAMWSGDLSVKPDGQQHADVFMTVWDYRVKLQHCRQDYNIPPGQCKPLQLMIDSITKTRLVFTCRQQEGQVQFTYRLGDDGKPFDCAQPRFNMETCMACEDCLKKRKLLPLSHQWAFRCPPDKRHVDFAEYFLQVIHSRDDVIQNDDAEDDENNTKTSMILQLYNKQASQAQGLAPAQIHACVPSSSIHTDIAIEASSSTNGGRESGQHDIVTEAPKQKTPPAVPQRSQRAIIQKVQHGFSELPQRSEDISQRPPKRLPDVSKKPPEVPPKPHGAQAFPRPECRPKHPESDWNNFNNPPFPRTRLSPQTQKDLQESQGLSHQFPQTDDPLPGNSAQTAADRPELREGNTSARESNPIKRFGMLFTQLQMPVTVQSSFEAGNRPKFPNDRQDTLQKVPVGTATPQTSLQEAASKERVTYDGTIPQNVAQETETVNSQPRLTSDSASEGMSSLRSGKSATGITRSCPLGRPPKPKPPPRPQRTNESLPAASATVSHTCFIEKADHVHFHMGSTMQTPQVGGSNPNASYVPEQSSAVPAIAAPRPGVTDSGDAQHVHSQQSLQQSSSSPRRCTERDNSHSTQRDNSHSTQRDNSDVRKITADGRSEDAASTQANASSNLQQLSSSSPRDRRERDNSHARKVNSGERSENTVRDQGNASLNPRQVVERRPQQVEDRSEGKSKVVY